MAADSGHEPSPKGWLSGAPLSHLCRSRPRSQVTIPILGFASALMPSDTTRVTLHAYNWLSLVDAREPIWASQVAQWLKNPPAMQETQIQSLGREDPLKKGITTHSGILAWRIPWTEEPDGLVHRVTKS